MTENLLTLIRELQSTESIQHFALAGGSNLAIRYKHRNSVDIDLFTNRIVGVFGWESIEQALRQKYGGAMLFCSLLNKELGDQYCFMRALIITGDEQIKIDMVQNVQHLDAIERVDDMNLFSTRDIGLFKLMAVSNRFAKKDVYDLDQITDHIELSFLLQSLREKLTNYSDDRHKCLFDLDQKGNPLNDINILLSFDDADYMASDNRHSHSTDRLDIFESSKTWMAAKQSWRKKVKRLTYSHT